MAATSKGGANLSKDGKGGNLLTWILGLCLGAAGLTAAAATFVYFKKRKKQPKTPASADQTTSPAGAPLNGTGSAKETLEKVNLGEY